MVDRNDGALLAGLITAGRLSYRAPQLILSQVASGLCGTGELS